MAGTGVRERWVGGVRSAVVVEGVNVGSRGSHSGVGRKGVVVCSVEYRC